MSAINTSLWQKAKKEESFRYCSYLILAAAFREADVNNTQTNLPKENT